MSSNAYAVPRRFELRPSRQRRRWRLLTHLAAAASLPLLQSVWLGAAIIVLLAISWRHSRAQPHSLLTELADGRWVVREGARDCVADYAGDAFVQPWLVILPLRSAGRRRPRYIAVFPDMLSADEFRRLRARLITLDAMARGERV